MRDVGNLFFHVLNSYSSVSIKFVDLFNMVNSNILLKSLKSNFGAFKNFLPNGNLKYEFQKSKNVEKARTKMLEKQLNLMYSSVKFIIYNVIKRIYFLKFRFLEFSQKYISYYNYLYLQTQYIFLKSNLVNILTISILKNW